MAVAHEYATCRHCRERIALRTYAAPYSPDEHQRTYGIRLWTAGNGRYPGDQRVCEARGDADQLPYIRHEPTT
jgi:hypothetical protein